MRPIPFEKKTVRVITKENNKKLDDMNLYEEFLTLQSKVSKLLKVKNDNLETFKKLQSDSYWLNVVDVLIWADLLFNRRDLPDKIKKVLEIFQIILKISCQKDLILSLKAITLTLQSEKLRDL